jgi:tetratricopeptide (TPR) repeat protein
MRDHEVPRNTLERFAAGDASEVEREQVLRHLLAGCEPCRGALRALGWHGAMTELRRTHRNVAPIGRPAGSYDEAFAAATRTAMAALDRMHVPAQRLLAELDAISPEQRELAVRNRARFAVGELALALVDRSYELRFSDHTGMQHYARLAVAAAEAARPETAGGRSLLSDCRARAWAQLGNAARIRAELIESERCFETALRHLEAGSGEPEPRAWVLFLLASLRITQRAFVEAVETLTEVGQIYRRLRDRSAEAGALIKLGHAWICATEPERAIPPLQRAIGLLHPSEKTLLLVATIDLVLCYIDIGHPQEAYDTAAMGDEHFETCSDELLRLRWLWQRGKVDRERGDLLAGEQRLARVHRGFLDANLPEQVAEISLDLAMLYARQGRRADFLRSVGEAAAIFLSLGARRELLASLGQLAGMLHQGEAAVDLLRQLVSQFRGGLPRAESA